MSFHQTEWSDDEGPAPAAIPAAAAPAAKGKQKATRVVKRRVGGKAVVVKKKAAAKKAAAPVKRKQEDLSDDELVDDGEDDEMGDDVMGEKATKEDERYFAKWGLEDAPANKRVKKNDGAAAPAPVDLGLFHSPTHPAFSEVVIRAPGGKQGGPAQGGWISKECRCMQCEVTRFAQKLVNKQYTPPAKRTVAILLDLDNFGFPQWVKHPAPPAVLESGATSQVAAVWGFYGLGFERYGKQGNPWDAIGAKSLFSFLRKNNQLQLSPCANFPQAADLAMQAVVAILRNCHICLVTSDKQHAKACTAIHAAQTPPPGQAKKLFTKIDPHAVKNDGAAVWKQVAAFCVKAEAADAE